MTDTAKDDGLRRETNLGSVTYAFATMLDSIQSFRTSPLDRAKALLETGELSRAVNCLSSSKDPAAVPHLAELASGEQYPYSVRLSAMTGLGTIAAASPAAAGPATEALLDTALSGESNKTYLAAIVLHNALVKIGDPAVHERISERTIAALCEKQFEGWAFRDGADHQVFCWIAGGLRDLESAAVVGALLERSDNGFTQHHLLEVIAKRPQDELLAQSLRRVRDRGDSGQAVQLAEGIESAATAGLRKYEQS